MEQKEIGQPEQTEEKITRVRGYLIRISRGKAHYRVIVYVNKNKFFGGDLAIPNNKKRCQNTWI
jgi:hypothetical protein